MGIKFMDQYSLLHFAVGIVSKFWNISLLWMIVFHAIFEFVENTDKGMYFINTWIPFWPGGKTHSDSILNRVGDTTFAGLGWIVANLIIN